VDKMLLAVDNFPADREDLVLVMEVCGSSCLDVSSRLPVKWHLQQQKLRMVYLLSYQK
jgi:hypothetical protein